MENRFAVAIIEAYRSKLKDTNSHVGGVDCLSSWHQDCPVCLRRAAERFRAGKATDDDWDLLSKVSARLALKAALDIRPDPELRAELDDMLCAWNHR